MSVPEQHHITEQHKGMLLDTQIADGTPDAGTVPIANGDGTVTWGEAAGGSGCTCCHQHESEEFVALGDEPETFTLTHEPLYGARVSVQGLRVTPSEVTVTGSDVALDTITDDVVVIDYERECAAVQAPPILGGEGSLSVPGTDAVHNGKNNILAQFTTTGPAFLVVDITTALNAAGSQVFGVTTASTEINSIGGASIPVNRYLFPLQAATTYYIFGKNDATYDGTLSGAGDYAWYYPAGTGTAISYPGTADTIFADACNQIASFETGQAALFITIVDEIAPDPADWYVYVTDSVEGDLTSFAPVMAAGTYVFCPLAFNPATPPDLYRILAQNNDLTYHADLTGSGFYELHDGASLP